MVNRIPFSEEEKSIDFIWNWYEDQKEALRELQNGTRRALFNKLSVADKFQGLTPDELDEYFSDSESELDHLVCFDLISSTEALLRIDYLKKVYNREGNDLARSFRLLHKEKGNRISLEEDIINTWKNNAAGKKKYLSDFLGLLKYRHWLAHGRYWNPKLGMEYNPDVTYEISEKIASLVLDGTDS